MRVGLVLTLLLALPAAHAAESFKLEEVAPGIQVHQDRHVGIEDPARGDSANIGFIVGGRCVVVIDTGGSIATGRALRASSAAATALPVCYVINTHGHSVHVIGNAALCDSGATFVGHAALAAVLDASAGYFAERFGTELAGAGTPPLVLPTRSVEAGASLGLDLGQRELVLRGVPVAHSAADLTVHDLVTGTLWSGDLVFVEHLPVLDASHAGWQAWMQTAGATPFARVVPGHGPPAVAWPQALALQRDYLAHLARDVRAALARGGFPEDVQTTGVAPEGWQVATPHARNLGRGLPRTGVGVARAGASFRRGKSLSRMGQNAAPSVVHRKRISGVAAA
jgi:quinoprotein relay system zinc metallohydrolase 2